VASSHDIALDLKRRLGSPPSKKQRYSSLLAEWVEKYFTDRQPLTPLLGLPVAWQIPILSAVCGLGDYESVSLGVMVRLRNEFEEPIHVQVGNRTIQPPPKMGRDGAWVNSKGLGRTIQIHRTVGPDEEIELSACASTAPTSIPRCFVKPRLRFLVRTASLRSPARPGCLLFPNPLHCPRQPPRAESAPQRRPDAPRCFLASRLRRPC